MSKKTWLIIILVIVLLVAGVVCLVPRITPIDLNLNAVKLDADGNAVGTAAINLHGSKLDYLFLTDRLQLSILPFDDLTSITLSTYDNGISKVEGAIQACDGKEYVKVSLGGWNTSSDDSFFGDLGFSEDLDRWIFCSYADGAECYYVASVSGSCTTEALVEYFEGLIR